MSPECKAGTGSGFGSLYDSPEAKTAMTAHRVETTLSEDGTLALRDLPFRAGERVEVIILVNDHQAQPSAQSEVDRFPLRGTQPYQFDDPFTPAVPEEDWDALKD